LESKIINHVTHGKLNMQNGAKNLAS
jgi:hypothetical protein